MKDLLKAMSLLVLTFMLSVNFISCSSGDDNEPEMPKFSMIGNWMTGSVVFITPVTPIPEVIEGSAFIYINMTADGSMTFYEIDVHNGGFKPQQLTGSYVINGDQLVIKSDNQYMNGTYTIEEATQTKCILLKKTSNYTIRLYWYTTKSES